MENSVRAKLEALSRKKKKGKSYAGAPKTNLQDSGKMKTYKK